MTKHEETPPSQASAPATCYAAGQRVRINWPGLREHGSFGIVKDYDPTTEWHRVELEREKPPYRGKYKTDELEAV